MAALRFLLLVAFLVAFIGFIADAKPIEKPDEKEEKDAPTEVTKDEDEGDDDADAPTLAEARRIEDADKGEKVANKEESTDENKIEKDILDAEGRSPDGDDKDVHTEGEQRDINGGNYDHHSSACPCMHDLLCSTGRSHHGLGLGHGCGCGGCGCCHGALGPSGVGVAVGSHAGHLGTFVCNNTCNDCGPNFGCSNICGNVAMGLPHPECQTCTTQDKNQEEQEKCYHPSCQLVCINGNVGLSLPHPCIQLDKNQTCNQGMLTNGCGGGCGCCNHGSCGCGCGSSGLGGYGSSYVGGHSGGYGGSYGGGYGGYGGHGCGLHHCGCGRDDISGNTGVLASGDGPNDEESNAVEPEAAAEPVPSTDASGADGSTDANATTAKSPVKRFDAHADEEDVPQKRDDVLGGNSVKKCGDLCCNCGCGCCGHREREVQSPSDCPCIGTDCQNGHVAPALPHPGAQLTYQHGVYDNECDACACNGHVHNPLPNVVPCCNHGHHGCCGHHGHHGCCGCHHGHHSCCGCHHGHHGCCGCHHGHHDCCHHDDHCCHECCHHDHHCGHDCCHHDCGHDCCGCHHGHHGCCHNDCCDHGHCGHDCHHDCCHHDCCHHDCCHHDCCHHKRTVVPIVGSDNSSDGAKVVREKEVGTEGDSIYDGKDNKKRTLTEKMNDPLNLSGLIQLSEEYYMK